MKGRLVCIYGRVKSHTFTDEDGVKYYATEMIAANMRRLADREAGGAGGGIASAPAPDSALS